MSYQAPCDQDADAKRRARYIAFKRKRRKQKQIRALCLLGFFVLSVFAVIYLGYRGIKYLYNRHIENITYVDFAEDGRNLSLVENINSVEAEKEAFFLIDPNEKETVKKDARKQKYEGIEKGSKGLVIVDAGHGGFDGGAEDNGVVEKDINLAVSYKLRDELEMRGYSVFLTRPDDEFVGLTQRASLANGLDNPLCLVSIHQNSVDGYDSICGIEAWTYDRHGCTELGDAICECASKTTGAPNRGTSYRTNLVVTSKTIMPAVIIECGYISNEKEANNLNSPDYQEKISIGIADGVEKFTESYYAR